MAKTKTVFFCQNCGHESPKWLGKCPSCGQWNTFVEEVVQPASKNAPAWQGQSAGVKRGNKPKKLAEVEQGKEERLTSPDAELNRVLGGGIVKGSLVLMGGEPGIGKSTLMLQLALQMPQIKVLYVSGEESEQQIKMRAGRMPQQGDNCFLLTETAMDNIFQQVEALEPQLVILDSIQTMHSAQVEAAAGSVSQVRQCAAEVMRFAKQASIPFILIGHITKEGSLAGPKVLEHMVDTVLQFEGDRHLSYRILRTQKNRFGSTAELGIYEMQSSGLRQVSNPSEILITQREESLSGVAIAATLEGNRPLLIEVQALASTAAYGTPQRSATGFDIKRLNMLLAVLEKRAGLRLGNYDVFLNMAGGLRIDDPAVDLAICVAITSSLLDVPLPDTVAFAAELGLGGEIRAVNRVEGRITEAQKLGFKEILVSKYHGKALEGKFKGIKVVPVGKLEQVIRHLQLRG